MKKSLYLTTALVAAGFMTLGAADVAAAGKKGKMSITGSYEAAVGYAKQQGAFENNESDTSRDSYNTIDVKTDSEIHFKASHVTDGGLKVGVAIELEGDQPTGADIDGSYVTVGGGFGTVMLGNSSHAAAAMSVSAPWTGVIALTGPELSSWVIAPAAVGGGFGTNIGAGDHEKIRWMSNAMSGFSVGASYTPSTTVSATQPVNGGTANPQASIVDGAIKYSGKMGGSTVTAGYQMWQTDAGTASVDGWSAGLTAATGAFTVGVAYKDVESSGKTAAGVSVGTGADSADEETVAAGVTWKQGKLTLGLGYMAAALPKAVATNGDDEATKWVLGSSFEAGPGVSLLGTIASAKWADEATANTANNNKGVAIVGGVKIAF